jgi:hypothetical protein
MIDLRRLRGPSIAVAGVLLALVAWDVLLRATLTTWPAWLPRGDWSVQRAVNYDRVGGELAALDREGASRRSRWGACLGTSTLESAVDPDVLDARVDPPMRWFNLVGYAATGTELEMYARLLFRSRIKPEMAVFALNRGMLAESDRYRAAFLDDQTAFVTAVPGDRRDRAGPRAAVEDMATLLEINLAALLNRALPNRARVKAGVDYVSFRARLRMFEALGFDTESSFGPRVAPRQGAFDPSTPNASDEETARFVAGYHARGWTDPDQYGPDNRHARALVRAIRGCRARGIRVVVVLLPESSRLRALLPPEAERCLCSAFEAAFGKGGVDLIDLRDAVPDPLFHDPGHVNYEGKRLFSDRLARLLKERAGGRTARDAASRLRPRQAGAVASQ